MQRTLLTVLLPLAFLTLVPMTTMAQDAQETGSGVMVEASGSGRALPDVLSAIESMIIRPKDTPPAVIAVDAKLLQEWKTEALRIRERQWQNRRDCNDAVRRANRDTLMTTATRCVRNDLLMETSLLRKQQEIIDAMPLLNGNVRADVQEAMDAFGDASTAILNAIDAGLFSQMQTLRQAVRNLHTQYRQTLSGQLSLLRQERERTWLGQMHGAISRLYAADSTAEDTLTPAALCLEEAASLLQASTDLQTIRSKNSECRILMLQAVSASRIPKEPQE